MPVIVSRHGERLDFASPTEWFGTPLGGERPWDPPLTDAGRTQAVAMGESVKTQLHALGLPPVSAVYCSPLTRTVQTAADAITGLGDTALQICVEDGLLELLSEDWIRSWGAPGADGQWGGPMETREKTFGLGDLHVGAQLSPQLWAKGTEALNEDVSRLVVVGHPSVSAVRSSSIAWGALETWETHTERVVQCISQLEARHPSQTILCLTHGAPVGAFFQHCGGAQTTEADVGYCSRFIYDRDATGWRRIG